MILYLGTILSNKNIFTNVNTFRKKRVFPFLRITMWPVCMNLCNIEISYIKKKI